MSRLTKERELEIYRHFLKTKIFKATANALGIDPRVVSRIYMKYSKLLPNGTSVDESPESKDATPTRSGKEQDEVAAYRLFEAGMTDIKVAQELGLIAPKVIEYRSNYNRLMRRSVLETILRDPKMDSFSFHDLFTLYSTMKGKMIAPTEFVLLFFEFKSAAEAQARQRNAENRTKIAMEELKRQEDMVIATYSKFKSHLTQYEELVEKHARLNELFTREEANLRLVQNRKARLEKIVADTKNHSTFSDFTNLAEQLIYATLNNKKSVIEYLVKITFVALMRDGKALKFAMDTSLEYQKVLLLSGIDEAKGFLEGRFGKFEMDAIPMREQYVSVGHYCRDATAREIISKVMERALKEYEEAAPQMLHFIPYGS